MYVVLVQNEATAGGAYDFYEDVTGQRYHFPAAYKGKIRPGRRFLYYRGVRRAGGGRRIPEYFGIGMIGDVRATSPLSDGAPGGGAFYADLEDYYEFPTPVPFRRADGSHYESIASNLWGVVREIAPEVLQEILTDASAPHDFHPARDETYQFPDIEDVEPVVDSGSPLWLPPAGKPAGNGLGRTGPGGRSRFSKAVGDRAEEIVFRALQEGRLFPRSRKHRWVARDGEKPGWDIELLDEQGDRLCLEVKGTTADRFTSIEITAGEWEAAKEEAGRYLLVLVTGCRTKAPRIRCIENPAAQQGSTLVVEATAYRLTLIPGAA